MKLPKILVDSTRWPRAALPGLLALGLLLGSVGCAAPAQSGTAVAGADTTQVADSNALPDSKPSDSAPDTAGKDAGVDAAKDSADAVADAVANDTAPGDAQPTDAVGPADSEDTAAPADASDGGDASDSDTGPSTCADAEKWCNHTFVWPAEGDESSVEARGSWDGWKVGIPLTLNGSSWSGSGQLPQGQQFVYKFRIVRQSGKEDWKPDPGATQLLDDGYGGKNAVLPPLSCPSDGVCPAPKTICGVPAKLGAFDWRDAVLYFVFVDRFANGDPSNDQKASSADLADIANWNGGDWKGVTQKITSGYFKELGVNALWLTVPMDNTAAVEFGDDGKKYTAYHGYWPKDVNQPNSHFGTMADLQALVQAAHAQGIQVVLDYAMNHVHKDSPIFQNHPEWFHPLTVSGQECVCGSGVCPWDGPSGVWCWFRNYLPDFDFDNADARKASIDNVIWWMQQSGADGLRLDAIKHVEGAWLTELRTRLLNEVEPVRGQHIWLVGETYTGDQGFIKSFVDPCAKLDGQFDFPLRAVLDQVVLLRQGKMKDLEKFMLANDSYYGNGAIMSTFAGNHDLPRIIHYAQDNSLFTDIWSDGKSKAWNGQPGVVAEKSAYERIAVAMTVLMGSPGVPLLYYGDEIGLPGAGDPDNRRPMQWTDTTDNQKWLLAQHQKLGKIRSEHPALRRGVRQSLWAGDDVWAWSMTLGTDVVYVAINRSDAQASVGGLPGITLKDLLSGDSVSGPDLVLPPRSARVLAAP